MFYVCSLRLEDSKMISSKSIEIMQLKSKIKQILLKHLLILLRFSLPLT